MAVVRILPTHDLSPGELGLLRHLLDQAFEGGFTDEDWDHTTGGVHVIVGEDPILSHASIVERLLIAGDRALRTGYVEGVATRAGRRLEGHATGVMRIVGEVIATRYEIGALSTGLPGFYSRLGWERWQGPTFTRAATGLRRTADDDDSVMFLRTAATATLDPTVALSCEWRDGDVW